MKSSFKWVRNVIRSTILLVFGLLIISMVYPLGIEGQVLNWMTGLDPWFLFNHASQALNIPVWAFVCLLTLLAALWWGRVFCSWICPLGVLLDWTDQLGRWLNRKLSFPRQRLVGRLNPYRYYCLVLLSIIFIISSSWVIFLTPFALMGHEIVRMAFAWIPWTLMGILVLTLIGGRIWCSFICPTGLIQTLAGKIRRNGYVTDKSCNHCGTCARLCPAAAAPAREGAAEEGCLVCGTCREVCPLQSVQWGKLTKAQNQTTEIAEHPTGSAIPRRRFVIGATLVVSTAFLWNLVWTRAVQAQAKFLRPPGARLEPEFNDLCSRCGRCLKVCPTQALWAVPVYEGLSDFETPHLIPRRGRCDLCMACQEICPTGAIMQVPVEQVKIGTAAVDQTRCLAWTEEKLCFLCGEQCPFLAIQADEMVRPIVIKELCVGCGACEYGCPVEGKAAVRVFRD